MLKEAQMSLFPLNFWQDLLQIGLQEDSWNWDWTSIGATRSGIDSISGTVTCKSSGVWAASGVWDAATKLSRALGFSIQIQPLVHDGQTLEKGMAIAHWSGHPRGVLALERPVLNLAAYASGIATLTQKLVHQINSLKMQNPPRISATRKILPAYRDLAIHSVLAGGGHSHRVSLSGGILIKENHIATAGSIGNAVKGARAAAPHGLKIEAEVQTLGEMEEAILAGVDGVLLDNFEQAEVKRALELKFKLGRPAFIEVSGGIREDNIQSYALDGVDVISVGALTHQVASIDLSLVLKRI